jgi:hypothetical protein
MLVYGLMLISACGPVVAGDSVSLVDEAPASPTPGLVTSATSLPATLVPLPSATGTLDPTQTLLEKHQQDILTSRFSRHKPC